MRKIKCCKQERESQFCPDCGKRLQDDPFATMLKYFRSQADIAKTSLDRVEKWAAEKRKQAKTEDCSGVEGRVSRFRTTFNKWDSWASAIEQIIKERQSQ